jgi:hypothetical protein
MVASLLVAFLVTIACADPLCCSDGCERGGMATTHSAQTGADCPTCLSAVVPHKAVPIVRTETVTQITEGIAAPPTSIVPAGVDHPPRLA